MNDHPVATTFCVMCGVFGAVFIVAFLLPFDEKFMAADRADRCEAKEKKRRWLELILSSTGSYHPGASGAEYKKTWREVKDVWFLLPLGVALCFISWIVHRIWLS